MKKFFRQPYNVFYCILLIYAIFGLFLATPVEIINGIRAIIVSPDILITDYIEVGGLGAALFNSALTGLFCTILLKKFKHVPNGYTIMTLWLICGFAFFGKNTINILPILFGGFLFSVFVREPFSKNVLATLLGTTLSPAVSQMAHMNLHPVVGLVSGCLLGTLIGFVIEPLAKSCLKSHDGFNLYNVGFAAGILSILIMAIFRNYGVNFSPVNIWSSGNNTVITIFICTISITLIVIGYICSDYWYGELPKILSKRWVSFDYYDLIKETCYINMGMLGLFSIMFVNVIGVELSGPIIGGIFTIMGFGCCGKTIKNILPIMIGAMLAAYLSIHQIDSSLVVIAILFSTCLSPISERFGVGFGILAGFLHLNLAMNLGMIHGGLNLYNNGLAGGFVAMILVPLIRAIDARNSKNKLYEIKPISKEEIDLQAL